MATDINELISQIPMNQLAQQLGVDEQTAEQATRQALPALLGGMQANAHDPAGAASLSEALGQHDDNLLEGGVDFNQVDTDDGDKIVGNIFGPNREQVVNQLGGFGGGGGGGAGGSGLIAKLLPMLAPIVMSYLAKQFSKRGGAAATASATGGSAAGGAGGLEDLLGGLMGGQGGQAGGLGDLLGGLLGGGRR
jgi:hypothetical protein